MKTKCITILCCLTMGIVASEEQTWSACFEQKKLDETTYKEVGSALAICLSQYKQDFDLFSDAKLWLIKQKSYRESFNKGTLDIEKYNKIFRFYNVTNLSLPYTEKRSAPFYREYSRIASSLFRLRFEKIIGLRQDEKGFEKQFKTIPSIIELAVHIDAISSLAQAVLMALEQKTKPLSPLTFEYYRVQMPIKQYSLLSLSSSESSQSFASSTSSQISSNSFDQSPPQPCNRRSVMSDDYSDTTIRCDTPDSTSEESEGSRVSSPIFELD